MSADSPPARLVLAGVRKRFGEHEALAGVDLDVRPGELFTLLGPSGCGKTTLLRVVAGFVTPEEGRVTLAERDLLQVPVHKRDVGLVFQSYALFPHLDVAENVAFGLVERGVPAAEREQRVREALARVRLEELAGRAPSELSGGQQQRVGIARALAIRPRVLLMDEPLSNLDAKLRLTMREEIRALQRAAETTTLYVTHDQEEALAISDRIAVLCAGRVEQVGTPWEVYRQPATKFVAEFVGRISWLEPSQLPRGVSAPEGAAALGFRPEDLTLGDASSERALRGVVAEASFTGPQVRVRVELDGGGALLVDEHRPRASRWDTSSEDALTSGREVFVALPESGHAFDAGGARLA